MPYNKAIIFFCFGSYTGGTQTRYTNLINFIGQRKLNYLVVLNEEFYNYLKTNNLLVPNKNISVIGRYPTKSNETSRLLSNGDTQTLRSKIKISSLFLKKNIWFARRLIRAIEINHKLRLLIKQQNIKSVYAIWQGGIYSWFLLRLLNMNVIYSYNDSSVSSLSKNLYYFFDSEYWVLKYCDKIDFLSYNYASILENKIGAIPDHRKSITPNSFINYEKYYPDHPKDNSVVFMSRLVAYKNPILFLESIQLFNERHQGNDVIFYIIGEGPLEGAIREFIANHKLDNVKFIGKICNSWEFLRKSKVFVSIQQNENYPSQSLLEAMACENAVIASDVGETRRVVTEHEGILVDLNSLEICHALLKLFTAEQYCGKLGENARKKVLQEHSIEKYYNYFEKLVEGDK